MLRGAFILAVGCALCGCSGRSASAGYAPVAGLPRDVAAHSPIEHVVFIVQENRSFNNLFYDFPGARTVKWGLAPHGTKIKIRARDLATSWDLGHASQDFFAACDGTGRLRGTQCRMDGWNREATSGKPPPNPAYSYVPNDQIAPYWTLAQQYVLADRMFSSNLDGSFVAHQYVVAAYADRALDFPDGLWGCEGGKTDTVSTITDKRRTGPPIVTCFNIATLGAEADAAKLRWRFYAGSVVGDGGLWSSYQADEPIYYGRDWKRNVVSPPSRFLRDVRKGDLAAITWITPTLFASDHPGINASGGPRWIASIVDAIGESAFWKSTAIFLMWDDWGGLYDPVRPVYEDYDGLGFRVPLVMISPYAKQGYVTHVQYETASVLRYIEDNFGLAPLAAADARANDPASDAFDYAQKPRAFKKIAGSRPDAYWSRLEQRAPAALPATVLGDD
jgi:phospholipase C